MKQSPSALLLIATGCQHCPVVLQAMTELVKDGNIGQLEIINIQQNPERAAALNVRSVPWVKIGDFELLGLRTKSELKMWADRVNDPGMMGQYFAELMTSGEISKVHSIIENNPHYFSALIDLMADDNTSLSARIGVGALMEEFSGSDILKQHIDALGAYTHADNARLRNDACHYLGLSQDPAAEKYIRPLLEDENAEVREVAQEALEELSQ